MYLLRLCCCFLFILTCSNTTEAQLFKRLKDRVSRTAERTANRKIDQKVTQKTEEAIDSVFQSSKREETSSSKQDHSATTTDSENHSSATQPSNTSTHDGQSNSPDVPIIPPSADAKSVYQFNYEIKTEVTSSDQNQKMKMSYLLNSDQEYMGIKTDLSDFDDGSMPGQSVMIMDNGDTHIFVDASGMKMQISAGMAQQAVSPTDQLDNYDYSKLQKTGKTKKILGYDCYEYTMQSEDYDAQFWAAPDAGFPNWMMRNTPTGMVNTVEGYIMEFWVKSSEGTMTSKVIAIDENVNYSIDSKDYKKMF